MSTMQSFLMLFYILDQCYDDCPEETLGGLLGAISPELWDDGQPADKAVLYDWEAACSPQTITVQNIVQKICCFLEHYEAQFGLDFTQTKRWLVSHDTERVIEKAAAKTAEMYQKFKYAN